MPKIGLKLLARDADLIHRMESSEDRSGARVRLTRGQIEAKLQNCPRLPSLSSVANALNDLLSDEESYNHEIASVIQRDPSLTARLLKVVNSVFFGLATPVRNVEEAVFYLGIRQIRQLATVTPVIEQFQKVAREDLFPWRRFWQHCIGAAILTRELVGSADEVDQEVHYVAGLLHDIGKIVTAVVFPDYFCAIQRRQAESASELYNTEVEILGMDHAEIGAFYLKNQSMPDVITEAAEHHHCPDEAILFPDVVGAVQVADLLLRCEKIGFSGDARQVTEHDWQTAIGWELVFPKQEENEIAHATDNLRQSAARLPDMLEVLV